MPKQPFQEVRVSVPRPATHLVHVEMALRSTGEAGERTLMLPKWLPGSYKIRDFARHVQDLTIENAKGTKLPVARARTDGWTFHDAGAGPFVVRYQVYCRDLTVDTSHVTRSHASILGPTVFLYDEHLRDQPWRVTLEVPRAWSVWSGLEVEAGGKGKVAAGRIPPVRKGKVTLLADDYDHLIDCPIECGEAGVTHHVEEFTAARKVTRLVFWQAPKGVDWKKVRADLKKLIEETAAIFGGVPYKHYTFITHVARKHGGGLEHRNSTLLGVDPLHLLDPKQYQRRWLLLCAHEFFHTWNVKRILPAAFTPYDYQQEVPSALLWLFEGGTSYYETPILNRAGLLDDEHRYHDLQELIKLYDTVPGRFRLSVADASRLAWTKLYQWHESNINTTVSYYVKGALVCFCLDAHIRANSRGKSLDDVMRLLWERYGQTGWGVPEDAVPDLVEEATGVSVRSLLRRWVDEPGELPLAKACKTFGLKLSRKHPEEDAKAGLGIIMETDGGKGPVVVRNVADRWDGADAPPGYDARGIDGDEPALDPGDQIVAIDGWKVTPEDLGKALAPFKPGHKVQVHLFRHGRLTKVRVTLVEKQKDKVSVKRAKKAADPAKRRLRQWETSLRA